LLNPGSTPRTERRTRQALFAPLFPAPVDLAAAHCRDSRRPSPASSGRDEASRVLWAHRHPRRAP
jgi:hypothetical protein